MERRLAELACGTRPADALVAFGAAGEARMGELCARTSSLAALVRARGPGRFVLHCRDPFAFAVGLLGLAHAGSTAVLAPNAQPGTLRALSAGASGVVSDGPVELPGLERLDPLHASGATERALAPLEPDAPLCEVYTSGTSGLAKPIPKALSHFETEAAALERAFGDALGAGTRVLSTVSFQHLYGLTFRLLWPLAADRPFSRDTPLHPEELCAALSRSGAFALATTPAHLRHLCRRSGELASLREGHRAIFCSAGPLDRATALRTADALGSAPLEIFGSTETGAVAVRQRSARDAEPPYRPLPGVTLEREPGSGRLAVRSGFVSVGKWSARGELRFVLGDTAELARDGAFRLLGRADRVVKIGDKRLALPELEDALAASPLVDEVAACTWSRGSAPRVGAVIVPSERGRAELAQSGRRELARALRAALAAEWDPVLLPRAWRFVDALPRDAQGKLAQASIAELFTLSPHPVAREPVLLSERRSGARLERRLRIPAELAHLRGHFPGFRLVPGVAQLGFAVDAAAALAGGELLVDEIEIVKFRHALRPGDPCDLRVELDPGAGKLRFELRDEDRVFSEGRLRVRRGAPS